MSAPSITPRYILSEVSTVCEVHLVTSEVRWMIPIGTRSVGTGIALDSDGLAMIQRKTTRLTERLVMVGCERGRVEPVSVGPLSFGWFRGGLRAGSPETACEEHERDENDSPAHGLSSSYFSLDISVRCDGGAGRGVSVLG